jgi:hypothetical protein
MNSAIKKASGISAMALAAVVAGQAATNVRRASDASWAALILPVCLMASVGGAFLIRTSGSAPAPPCSGNPARYEHEHFYHGPAKERPSLADPDLDDEHWMNRRRDDAER